MTKKRKTSVETSSASDSSPALTQNSSPTITQGSSFALVQNSHEFLEENLKEALLDWLKEQTLYQGRSSGEKGVQENAVKDLADGLILVIKQTPSSDNTDLVLLEEIKKHVQKLPLDPKQKSNQKFMDTIPTQILDHLKNLQLFQDISLRQDRQSTNKIVNVKKKAAVVLLEDIANWVQNLPIEADNPEEAENYKEQLESKLVHKIGELNMNTEVFNDDFMYDDILGDEIDNLLGNISSQSIINNLPGLKKDFLAIVKKARKKILDENVGQIYKKQLCETIAKTLPSFELSVEGKASFEVLKDNVTDAFINMRYVGNNKEEVSKLKKKINDEINTFCNNYLKRCPAVPLDTTRLNEDLYNALKNIAEPENESFSDDVELVRIKNEINNWVKELPLKNHTGQEKLHTNKMISILAKKIHDIENEKDLIPAEEYEETIKRDVVKFSKKLPMTDNNDDINELIDFFLKNLRDSEESRKLNASSTNSVPPFVKGKSKAKIRISFNDASVSLCPIDSCSQTSSLVQKSSSVQTPCKKMHAVGSQMVVTPNVVANEYHWDSIDESCMQSPRVACPCPTSSRPPYSVLPKPLQSPISQRGDESSVQQSRISCPSNTAPRPHYEVSQLPHSPVSRGRSECTPAGLNSCLTTRPFPPQPFENQFTKPRDPDQINSCNCAQQQIREPPPPCLPPDYNYDNHYYQLSENPAPCRHEPLAESARAGKQCSDQSFGSVLDENNSFQRDNQHDPSCQMPRAPSPSPPYPYLLSTGLILDRPEKISQRNRTDSQNNQYPRQPCPCPSSREMPAQRNIQDSQYVSYTPCPGSSQMSSRNQGSHQDNQPMSPSIFMTPCPNHHCQGQPYMAPRSSMTFSRSPQMPCAFDPKSPCYMRPELPISSEEYETGLNCSFQNSAMRLGTFNDDEPQACMSRYHDWGKVRDDFEYWERERQIFDSLEVNNRRDRKKCKICKHRYGEYNGRHF